MTTHDIDYEVTREDKTVYALVTVEIEHDSEVCPGSVAIHACDKDGGEIDLTEGEEEEIMERIELEALEH